MLELSYPRRRTRTVRVGQVCIGSEHPVVVQSMATRHTRDVDGVVDEAVNLWRAGCEIVRVTAPSMADAVAIGEIRAKLDALGCDVPLAADVHHDGSRIAVEVTKHVDKVRINPGLFVFRKARTDRVEYTEAEHAAEREAIEQQFLPVIEACLERGRAMRIGVNHGSLSQRMLVTHGDTPQGMVASAMEFIGLCRKHDFHDLVVSLKASRVPVMLAAYRLMARTMDEAGWDYPLHLGVTEAGDRDYARIKSAIGIGTLLAEGIGDTIRVSLSEPPVNEIPVCYEILQGLGLRKTKTEFIACPSCGRTYFDLPTVLNQVRDATQHLAGIDIAVMGCIVNGPGEMADADYGYVGKGEGRIALYRGHEEVKTGIAEADGVPELIALLKADGVWREPETD